MKRFDCGSYTAHSIGQVWHENINILIIRFITISRIRQFLSVWGGPESLGIFVSSP
jgi:hypothetical protein